jgi:LPPG:FO 2-phospho-L-lactate transferase
VLAGGTGGAALAAGIQSLGPAHELTVIANTADDDDFWGLRVCPDVDAVIYRLAGLFNAETGYGVKGDTFHTLDALRSSGEETWFQVGDRDLATHIVRTEMLARQCSLTETTVELCRRYGLRARVLPMSDEPVRTRFMTVKGELSFQEYFVREHLQPKLLGIRFAGIDAARRSREVTHALEEADLVVIGPSNPLISVAPILELLRDALVRERTVAVTPIVGGVALKGPTVEMMRALGPKPEPIEVARLYRDVAGTFVLDERDRGGASAIEQLGYRVIVCDTVMRDGGRTLAKAVLSAR